MEARDGGSAADLHEEAELEWVPSVAELGTKRYLLFPPSHVFSLLQLLRPLCFTELNSVEELLVADSLSSNA